MDPTILTYIGFIVAVIIIIWAALELRSRLIRYTDMQAKNTWIRLDPRRRDVPSEEPLPLPGESDEEQEEHPQDIHLRARQNGHHSGSKHPL